MNSEVINYDYLETKEIYSFLYLSELSDEQSAKISRYIDDYLEAFENYSLDDNINNANRLQLLSGPVDEIYNLNNEYIKTDKKYPAIEMITSKIDRYGQSIEQKFNEANSQSVGNSKSLVLRNPNAPKSYNKEDSFFNSNAAFWQAPLIICLTIIFGLIIGAVTWYLQ